MGIGAFGEVAQAAAATRSLAGRTDAVVGNLEGQSVVRDPHRDGDFGRLCVSSRIRQTFPQRCQQVRSGVAPPLVVHGGIDRQPRRLPQYPTGLGSDVSDASPRLVWSANDDRLAKMELRSWRIASSILSTTALIRWVTAGSATREGALQGHACGEQLLDDGVVKVASHPFTLARET